MDRRADRARPLAEALQDHPETIRADSFSQVVEPATDEEARYHTGQLCRCSLSRPGGGPGSGGFFFAQHELDVRTVQFVDELGLAVEESSSPDPLTTPEFIYAAGGGVFSECLCIGDADAEEVIRHVLCAARAEQRRKIEKEADSLISQIGSM